MIDTLEFDKVKQWPKSLWSDFRPAWVITRREVRDTLRDWRIVFPIVILVTFFPFLANFAASQGIDFVNEYGASLIIERLFPFLMLVVGFFPSSFSLVIALETFVGEKERGSLESLLATPLTDRQLYLGKLLASTIPPVVASYLGMGVYLGLLNLSMGWRPEPELLVLAVLLSTVEALVMVSGAVIVSSQATSVRAANLLASFIIIPMAFLLQAQAGFLLFADYAILWWITIFLVVVNILLIRLGIRVFDREHLLGRDLDYIDLGRAWKTFWDAALPRRGLKALYFEEIPALLRAMRAEILVTFLIVFVGGALVGMWGAARFPLPASLIDFEYISDVAMIEEAVGRTGLLPVFSTEAVFYNNARALLGGALLSIFSLGVLGGLLLLAPIALIVYVMLQVMPLGISPWLFLTAFILPHGILELPAALLATAQAMRMGDVILEPPDDGGGMIGIVRELGRFVKLFVALVLPLLLIAAWIEVNITPHLVVRFFGQMG